MVQDNLWISLEAHSSYRQQKQPIEEPANTPDISTDDVVSSAMPSLLDITFQPTLSIEGHVSSGSLYVPTLDLDDDLWASPSESLLKKDEIKVNVCDSSIENSKSLQLDSTFVSPLDDEIIPISDLNDPPLLWQEEEHINFDVAMDAAELLDLEAELLAMELAEEQEQEDVSEGVPEATIDKRGRASGWMGSCSVLYIDWSNEELAQQEALKRLGYDKLSISEETRTFIIQAARTSSITRRQERYYTSLLIEARTSLGLLSHDQGADEQKTVLRTKIAEIEKFLVSKMQWAAIKKAPHFLGHGLDIDDLIQSGMLGVVQGVRAFDPTRNSHLLVAVNWHVFAQLNRSTVNNSRLIALPAYLHEQSSQLKQQSLLLESSLGRLPRNDELAECLHIPVQRVEEILRADSKIRSLDDYRKRESTHNGYSFQKVNAALLVDEDAIFQEEVEQSSLKQEIEALLDDLTPREQSVLTLRYDLNDEVGGIRTLEEVGQELRVTRERVRQIEDRAFRKILAKFGLRRVKNTPHRKEKGESSIN